MSNTSWPTQYDNLTPITLRDQPSLASVINALQQYIGTTGSPKVRQNTDTGWQSITTFSNGWVQYDLAASPVRWRIVNGIVWVQGAVVKAAAGPWDNTPAFQLPNSLYWPSRTITTWGTNGTSSASNFFQNPSPGYAVSSMGMGLIYLDIAGNLVPHGVVSSTVGAAGNVTAGPCYFHITYPAG